MTPPIPPHSDLSASPHPSHSPGPEAPGADIASGRIPIPRSQRWRDFRIHGIPVLVFAVSLACVVHLWKNNVVGTMIVGEAEGIRANASAPQAGTLAELRVAPFQIVAQGDVVAVVRPSDPRARLALLQAQVDLFRIRMDPVAAGQRNAMDYERLRLEWLQQKVDLASSRVALEQAENELRRSRELFEAKILSEQLYDGALKTRDQLLTEVKERSLLIEDLAAGIQRYESLRESDSEWQVAAFDATAEIRRIEGRLRLLEQEFEPVMLLAPIGGMVGQVLRQAGEHVAEGEPIITLNARRPDRILGYCRQPLPIEPEPGMRVIVLKRSARRERASAEVRQVGFQFELITNALALVRPGGPADMGLAIEVSVPAELGLRPGEHVEMILVPR